MLILFYQTKVDLSIVYNKKACKIMDNSLPVPDKKIAPKLLNFGAIRYLRDKFYCVFPFMLTFQPFCGERPL